jgi:hypothetical protein
MQFLRYGHDAYGQSVVNGVSWDLLAVAFWAGVAVIAGHLVWRALKRGGRQGGGRTGQ